MDEERQRSMEALMVDGVPVDLYYKPPKFVKREQTEHDRYMIKKYFSKEPPVDVKAMMDSWQLRYGEFPAFKLVSPSNMATVPAATGSKVELKGGSVLNKDLGESSETMIESSNHAAYSSATVAAFGTKNLNRAAAAFGNNQVQHSYSG